MEKTLMLEELKAAEEAGVEPDMDEIAGRIQSEMGISRETMDQLYLVSTEQKLLIDRTIFSSLTGVVFFRSSTITRGKRSVWRENVQIKLVHRRKRSRLLTKQRH